MKSILPLVLDRSFGWPIGAVLLVLGFVYGMDRHPDAPWGDALGYALSIAEGWDLATNANSHFAWLAWNRALFLVSEASTPLEVLTWGSVFWGLACILLLAFLVREQLGPDSVWLPVFLVALSFPFWRSATVPEVYTAELFFWLALLFLGDSPRGRGLGLVLVHALGLLVHIHLILAFPYVLLRLWRKKTNPVVLLVYGLALVPVWFSVYGLKLHSLEAVLFDQIGDKIRTVAWQEKAIGPFFVATLLAAYAPVALGLWGISRLKSGWVLKSNLYLAQGDRLVLLLPLLAFAAWFPEPGIWVFLLPAWVLLILEATRGMLPFFHRLPGILLVLSLHFSFFGLAHWSLEKWGPAEFIASQKMKGGIGFLVLPWARGNVGSAFEWVECHFDQVPESYQWNSVQVRKWRRRYPRVPEPCYSARPGPDPK